MDTRTYLTGINDEIYNNFVSPPEAPVFTPTEEEFSDPLGYIAKIRPVAEKAGICKIKPPPDWQPPFAVDVEKFKFTPRIQRLNELEAKSRIKLNFLDRLAKFWELQGCSLRIPHVERKLLDLAALFKLVQQEGGMEMVTRDRKWSRVAALMSFPLGKGVGSCLRNHYERILYPYELFKRGVSMEAIQAKKIEPSFQEDLEEDKSDQEYKPHYNVGKELVQVRKSKRTFKEDPVIDYSANSELKKLQFYGAGPKAAVPATPNPTTVKEEKVDVKDIKDGLPSTKTKAREKAAALGNYTDVDMYLCLGCGRGDGEEYMLLCDGCDDAFHTYCLMPPLAEVPKGDWRCPKCVKQMCCRPQDPYGFEQAKREYTLQTFGEMADQFKSNYFNKPVHVVPCSEVEKEFWRLVNCIEEDVSVQYGADIHASEMGSGFPTNETKDLLPEDEEYVKSGWNLNNLPVLEQSVLCHINADISGMKIPWCYVGMCFSSFCWHNEDHWSYSINYMHWGEPKTWYGVPGMAADQFEEAMKAVAPELFEQWPDLLHQLTTIMNPNILTAQSVPIVRTDQHAGEFVVTFPRAYHAGFNQGYNFAEAVNFCPGDWLSMGRLCIDHYRMLHRQCVFSHEELICKMAADPDSLGLNLAASTHQDMLAIVEQEKKMRKCLLDRGTVEAEREAFELLPDDERQCDYCKTTCFLSGLTCLCRPNKLVCLHHMDYLCACPPSRHCLRYRYTLDELPTMLQRLKVRAESFDNWNMKVKSALEATNGSKLELIDLKELVIEAEEKKFPDSDLLQTLKHAVGEAEKCANVANQLVSKKVRTRNRQSLEGKYIAKLTLEELNCFYEQVISLPCRIREANLIKDLLDQVVEFQNEAQDALEAETPDSRKLEKLIDIGITLDVDLPEIPRLKQVLLQARWLDEVRSTLQDPTHVTLDIMRKLMESGVGLAPHPAVEKAMAELQELLTVSERWEEKARICLQARPRHVMTTLEAIIAETKSIPAYLPNVFALKEAVRKAQEWVLRVESVQNSENYPYLDILESLVNKGRPIPVRLDQLPQVESQVAAAKSWRERTARTFLKKNSSFSLLEVLSPRNDIGVYNNSKNKKKKVKEGEKENENNNSFDVKTEETRDAAAIVAAFKESEHREVDLMRDLRIRNMEKIHNSEGEVKYCVCRKGASGFMLQCELCKDWFHGTCVTLPKSANMKNKTSHAAVMQAAKDMKFLCPLCLRSRRPRLETILSLLVSLQKLPVRLPEGEALQCLTERAMAWQDRARQMLTTSELASALAKLSLLSQRMVEQAAREKTEKIINAELMKAANNPELQGHLASVTQSAFSGSHNGVSTPLRETGLFPSLDNDSSQSPLPMSPQSSQTSDDIMEPDTISSHGGMSSEHAYSSVSKANAGVSPRKHQRKSPLVPRQMEGPMLELSEAAKAQLEELLMEGDLLEVSLDETQHIWRILQACMPRHDDKFLEFEENEQVSAREKPEKEKKEKIKKVKKENKEKDIVKKKKRKKIDEEGKKESVMVKKHKLEAGESGKDGEKVKKKKIKPKVKDKITPVEMDIKIIKEKENKAKHREMNGGSGIGEKVKKIDKGDKSDKPKRKKKIKITKPIEVTAEKVKPEIKKKEKPATTPTDGHHEEEEDEDDCAAIKCLRPIGEAVNWVQCDGCEMWFHLMCVGLTNDEVQGDDVDYVCFKCVNKRQAAAMLSTDDIKDEVAESDAVEMTEENDTVVESENVELDIDRQPDLMETVEVKTEDMEVSTVVNGNIVDIEETEVVTSLPTEKETVGSSDMTVVSEPDCVNASAPVDSSSRQVENAVNSGVVNPEDVSGVVAPEDVSVSVVMS